jgi:hypothetical protein
MTPDVLSQDVAVTISGTITNNTTETIEGLKVALWADSSPITTMNAFRNALDDVPQAIAWEPYSDPGAAIDDLVSVAGTLAPGQSTAFSVSGRVSGDNSLGLSPGATYALGAQVWQEADDWYLPVGEARILAAFPESPGTTNDPPAVGRPQAVSVVVLNSVPSLVRPSTAGVDPGSALFSDDHLAEELSGRLAALLAYANNPNVTLVVDPALVDEVIEMTQGYTVRNLEGVSAPGVGVQVAQTWLANLNSLLADSTHSSFRGLYGTPDLAWVCSNERPDVLDLAAAQVSLTHPLSGLPTVAVASYGRTSSNLVECFEQYRPFTLLVDALDSINTLHMTQDTEATDTEPLRGFAVSNDIISDGSITTPAWHAGKSLVQVSQAMLAMRYVWALNEQPLVTVVDTTEQATVMATADKNSELIRLDAIDDSTAGPFVWNTGTVSAAFLTEDLPSLTTVAERRFDEWLAVTNRVQYVSDYKRQLITGAWSAMWNGNDLNSTAWLDAAYAPVLANLTGSVTISGSPEWHISSEVTQLPIQVSNSTNVTVLVHIEFASENEQRLHVPPSPDVEIGPGETVTVRVEPRAESNGTLVVSAWVATREGHRLPDTLSSNELSFVVSVSSAGRLAWLIIAASGVAFLGLTAWRVLDVRKHGKGDRASRVGLLVRFLRVIGRDPGVDDEPETQDEAD